MDTTWIKVTNAELDGAAEATVPRSALAVLGEGWIEDREAELHEIPVGAHGAPASDPPVVDPPVVDPPVVDPPVADPPVADPPVADPPVADPPKARARLVPDAPQA